MTRLVLADGRHGLEPNWRVEVTPDWLAAAEDRGAVLVDLVLPGTWPPGLVGMEPEVRRDTFTRGLDQTGAGGRVLHGPASVRLVVPWPVPVAGPEPVTAHERKASLNTQGGGR